MLRVRFTVVSAVMLLLAVVGAAPAAAGGGGCHATELTDAATTDVSMAGNCFTPAVARVGVGDTVTWSNVDPVPHTATGVAQVFDTGEFAAGDEVAARFDEAGVYPYACLLHPGMVGTVVVGDLAASAAAAPATPAAGTAWLLALAGALGMAGVLAFVLRPRLRRRAGAAAS